MKTGATDSTRRRRWLLSAGALAAAGSAALAADLRLQAILIRADNGEAESVNHYLTDPALRASLQAFTASKWTNFQEITNLTVAIPSHETREVKMSDHCALQIRNLGGAQVAIDCISQGKQISRGTNSLPLIFGGSDTNQTAWFVSLRDANAPGGAGTVKNK